MKYPMLSAALDEALAKFVRNNGSALIDVMLQSVMTEPVPEKLPPIPVTKEEVAHAD